jgi:hypothetical protein
MLQVAFAASVAPQAFAPVEMAKSVGLAPPIAMLLMFSVALPELASVADSADEVVPTVVLWKVSAGVSAARGAAALEKLAVTISGAVMVMVVEALLGLATLPAQLTNAKPVFGVAERSTTVPDA